MTVQCKPRERSSEPIQERVHSPQQHPEYAELLHAVHLQRLQAGGGGASDGCAPRSRVESVGGDEGDRSFRPHLHGASQRQGGAVRLPVVRGLRKGVGDQSDRKKQQEYNLQLLEKWREEQKQ